MSGREVPGFERWRQREAQRSRAMQQQELGVLMDQIRRRWTEQQAKVSKDWEDKEARVFDIFSRIESVVVEFKAAAGERQELERQVGALELENDQLKQVPADTSRQERLVRINGLRLEIQQLEDGLTRADAELRAANESKNRYKRLFLESSGVLRTMAEEEKRRASARK